MFGNNLLSPNQSEFRLCNSCINQLLSINHEILNTFGKGLVVRGIFLDVSKAFDKIWHDGLIFKLRQNGLRNKPQRVVLNGQYSSWADIRSGVPQG